MNIPEVLKQSIELGEVVLCLGAGASFGALNSKNQSVPFSNELRDMLCDKFLGGNYKDTPLDMVAGYAISQTDMSEVQNFIKEIFYDYKQADYHNILPTFRWKAIFTTNYDLIIEKTYESCSKKVQKLVPFTSDKERIKNELRDSNALEYVKLHGCISKSSDCSCPLILTKNQYGSYKKSRERLYGKLYEVAHEHPIIFIGQSMQDTDIIEILNKVREANIHTPKYYIVTPHADKIQKDFWAQQRIEVLEGTFEDFLNTLDREINIDFRGLPTIQTNENFPIIDKLTTKKVLLSENLQRFLNYDVDVVSKKIRTKYTPPERFFKGLSVGWDWIDQGLDFERKISEDIIVENIIFDDDAKPKFKMVLIKGPAGSGKSILLKQIAWSSAIDYEKPVIFIREYTDIDIDALKELLAISNKKLYLFIDNAASHIKFFANLCKISKEDLVKLTIISAERTNEWNINSIDIGTLPINFYELKHLNKLEAERLLNALERHKLLGNLSNLTREAQIECLVENYNEQLLVTLYEATKGRKFEDIIKDEYTNISPIEAKKLYLVVCILNRLNIPVRAGLISSMFNINFEEFNKRFFLPLEQVVFAQKDPVKNDYVYITRHPYIAQIIFEKILCNVNDRFNNYFEVFNNLNIVFDSDRLAFREMIKANNLLEIFNKDHELIKQIYEVANRHSVDDTYIMQQEAIYEMKRPNANLNRAKSLIILAEELDKKNNSIKHSKAELYLKLAENARTDIELERLLNVSRSIIEQLSEFGQISPYNYATLIKIEIIRLKYYMNNNSDMNEILINDIISNAEKNITKGLQMFPNDSILLSLETEYAQIIKNKDMFISSLERTVANNPRNSSAVSSLVDIYSKQNELDKALIIINKGLEANRGDKKLRYLKAKLLYNINENDNRNEIIFLLEKSFDPNDKNYDGKILYGRELFINKEFEKSKNVFESFENAYVSEDIKNKVIYQIDKKFFGKIIHKQFNFGFVKCSDFAYDIFVHCKDVDENLWENLNCNDDICFKIGFNFKGPVAINVRKY